jgi:hypothetical protein
VFFTSRSGVDLFGFLQIRFKGGWQPILAFAHAQLLAETLKFTGED